MKCYYIIALVLVSILLFGAGCMGECEVNSNCDDGDACTDDRCVDKKCVHTSIKDCHAGNLKCEPELGETKCTAPADCGSCSGKIGDYMSYKCDEKEVCVGAVSGEVKTQSFAEEITQRGGPKLQGTYTYEEPFDMSKSLFNIKFEMVSEEGASNVVIKKVQVLEKVYQKATRTEELTIYGESAVERHLWTGVPVIVDVPLIDAPVEKLTAEKKAPTIKVYYEYDTLSRGIITTNQAMYEKSMSSEMTIVNTAATKCPASCDDKNQCTIDSCSEQTRYFCAHTPLATDCCGNYKCDSTENECGCKTDCGPCERNFGEYISYSCENYKCLPDLRNPDVIKPKTLLAADASFRRFTAEIETTFDEPFDVKNSIFNVKMVIKSINADISGIKCTKMRLTTGNVLLGDAETSMTFGSVGETKNGAVAPSFAMRDPEEAKAVSLTISCEYDQSIRGVATQFTPSYSQNLGTITFVGLK